MYFECSSIPRKTYNADLMEEYERSSLILDCGDDDNMKGKKWTTAIENSKIGKIVLWSYHITTYWLMNKVYCLISKEKERKN